MTTNIRKLQEATSLTEIDTVLGDRKIGPALRSHLETGIILKSHNDPNQRQIGEKWLQEAIREMEDDDHDHDVKEGDGAVRPENNPSEGEKDIDKKINEEVLSNNNPHTANAGSEQSTDNTPPYPQEGKDSAVTDMKDATGENQMKEAGFPPMGIAGVNNGMEPQVAAEMGNGMPAMPPMTLPQQMRQTQYTVNETIKKVVVPYMQEITKLRNGISSLQKQVQELQLAKTGIALDMTKLAKIPAVPVRIQETNRNPLVDPQYGVPEFNWPRAELEDTRRRISDQDNLINQSRGEPYG